jgi:Family of unknown function (DUF6232)
MIKSIVMKWWIEMEEHVFLHNEEIRITSTRIALKEKTIAMQGIVKFELDREDADKPYVWLVFSGISLIYALSQGFMDGGGIIGLALSVLFGLMYLAVYKYRELDRKMAIILTLSGGKEEEIFLEDEDELKVVFNKLNEAIIFRG